MSNKLANWSQQQADKIAFRHVDENGCVMKSLTYDQLYQQAKHLSVTLKNLPNNNVMLLVYPSGLDFIIALFACFEANIIAVPTSVPKKNNRNPRFQQILKHSKCNYILTDDKTTPTISQQLNTELSYKLFATDHILTESQTDLNHTVNSQVKLNDIAFLQYTSGTTSQPKGVMVTHNNIAANLPLIQKALCADIQTKFVSWLPHYHDMGLISNILLNVHLGSECTLMSPVSFINKPKLWLDLITQYRATITGAPNFAFDLCVQQLTEQDKLTLDLRSLTSVFTGAEQIQLDTLMRFNKHFEVCGLNQSIFIPAYGLAESTLMVSSSNKTTTADNGIISVGSGHDFDLKIVDIHHHECAINTEGEIYLSGPSVAKGYWQDTQLTTEKFHAKIIGNKNHYLRTGDLGFVDEQGELFITGRIKDVIIIRGRNIHPQNIEQYASQVDSCIVNNGVAAFTNSKNELILLVEINRTQIRKTDFNLLTSTIKQTIVAEFGITVKQICYLKPFQIPRTTSGKLQRFECRERFESGKLTSIQEPPNQQHTKSGNQNTTRHPLINTISHILKIAPDTMNEHCSLPQLGADSLSAIVIQHHIAQHYAIDIDLETLLGADSVKCLLTKCKKVAMDTYSVA